MRKGAKLLYEFLNAGWKLIPNAAAVSNVKESVVLNADKSETSECRFTIDSEDKLRDYDFLLKLHNYDPHYFELVSAKNSKWGSPENM